MNNGYLKTKINEIVKNPFSVGKKLNTKSIKYAWNKLFFEDRKIEFVSFLSGKDKKTVIRYFSELKNEKKFFLDLHKKYLSVRKTRIPFQDWHPTIYAFVRAKKPEIFVETGVFEGLSTTLILKAMEKNKKGRLISFDKPPKKSVIDSTDLMLFKTLPKNLDSGWLVPSDLKKRWKLIKGDTKKMLASNLSKIGKIDVFMHDSLHTYNHMMWEYRTAWNFLQKKGVLLSDDVHFNKSFANFSKKVKRRKMISDGFGGIIR